MPRRDTPDPLAAKIGERIKLLRQQAGLTQEKLAYESEVRSKGYLSDIEKGLARPTITTLQNIAQHLAVDVLDLLTFPEDSLRHQLIDLTRCMKPGTIRKLVKDATGNNIT